MSDRLTEEFDRFTQAEARPVSWRVIGAAVQGVSHARNGLPCQDAQGYRRLPDGTLLVALADGAGSATRSDEGARCAVETALKVLAGELEGEALQDRLDQIGLLLGAFTLARQAVLELAEDTDETARSFATTLSLVVLKEGLLAVGQLGDGVVVARQPDGELFVASPQQRGEYANETYFLTQEDALEKVDVQVFEQDIEALAVMSDGLARLALRLPSQEPHAPFFGPLFAFLTSIEAEEEGEVKLRDFLSSERICARTDDDKALVLAVRE